MGFSISGGQVQFLANPPAMTNGTLPYAFVGPVNSTTVDFATLSTTGGMTYVSAYSGYSNSIGTNGTLNVAATANQSLTTASSCNALKLVGPATVNMSDGFLDLDFGRPDMHGQCVLDFWRHADGPCWGTRSRHGHEPEHFQRD